MEREEEDEEGADTVIWNMSSQKCKHFLKAVLSMDYFIEKMSE